MPPDAARWHLVGDMADLETGFVDALALLAASEENPFRIARQHAAMAALIHLGIVGQQEAGRPDRAHRLLAEAAIEIRCALELQRGNMLHAVVDRERLDH